MYVEPIEEADLLDPIEKFATTKAVRGYGDRVGNQAHPPTPALTPEILADLATSAAIANRSGLLRFLRSRVRQDADAEDLLQEFYLKVLCKGFQIRDADAIGPWMKAVLRRSLIDYYRACAAETRAAQHLEQCDGNFIADPTTETPTDSARIEAALHRIRPRYAELIERIDLRGEPQASVARGLAISSNNLCVLLHRARKALRQALSSPSQPRSACRHSSVRKSLISARPGVLVNGDSAAQRTEDLVG